MFAPFGPGAWSVLPRGLALAADGVGRPVFALEMVKRPDDVTAEGQYAILDLQLVGDYPMDAALVTARTHDTHATVKPAPIAIGFARLVPGGPDVALPADITAPAPLGWSAADGARWTRRLEIASAELIKGALNSQTLLFGARTEFTVEGVAPRIPATVKFQPAALLDAVLSGHTDRRIAAPDLLGALRRTLPIELNGTTDPTGLSEVLMDRLFAAWGTLVPAPGVADPPWIEFAAVGAESVMWDLNVPQKVPRAFAVQLDPLSALRQADTAGFVREITVPPLDLGFRSVPVSANLPGNRLGVPAIGVRIEVAPSPPARPAATSETLVLTSPDDSGRVQLRFVPEETLAYTVTTFAIVAADGLVQQYEALPHSASDTWLHLQASDFPITFAHLTASDRLLKLGTVSGTLTYAVDGKVAKQPIQLTAEAPDIAVAVPEGAEGASLALTATATDGVTSILLPPLAPGRIRLDVTSFPGYGPHRISLSCTFADDPTPLTIELQSEDGATQSTVTLTQAAPAATWGYVAASPFRAGFRVRPAGGTWSAVLPPTSTLTFNTGGTIMDTAIAPFDVEGVHLSPSANGATILYVPAAPTPELDPNGRPTLGVFKMPQATTLQLGAHFSLSAADLAALKEKVGSRYPSLRDATLQPAPIQVQKAAVVLADIGSAQTELGTSSTSAFPPFAAVFSLTLTPAQAAQAISAVGGRRGVLFVDYTILPQGATAPVVKRCDVATWFHGTDGLSHVRTLG
jgi:hypothetical protein